MFKEGKRGQVSIFVIVALLIVLGVGGYFALRGQVGTSSENGEFSDVFSYYQGCIDQYTKTGLGIASSQGGRINPINYLPGNNYAPFGNQLEVSGASVPYWLSVESNGMLKEQVPTRDQIETELSNYIASRLNDCDFSSFGERGIDVTVNEGNVLVDIENNRVMVDVETMLSASNENSSASKDNFRVSTESRFGSLYNDALKVYQKEQKELFLENYSFDVLQLYAPVDGVEIQCSPKIWTVTEVFSDLKDGLGANLGSLSFRQVTKPDYFNVDARTDNNVQIIYDKNWPSRFEVYGNEGGLLVASQVGNQQGLASLGFCYVPYHFVYDMFFPVLIRIYSEEEFFQFPVAVIVDKNSPRNAVGNLLSIDYGDESNICGASTSDLNVAVRGRDGAITNASVNYNCFDQLCPVGMTSNNGVVKGKVPACLNGFIQVSAPGYTTRSFLFSSHNASEADILLEKEYPVSLRLEVDGKDSNSLAFISLEGEQSSKQGVIPDSREISLPSGFYNVSVYQYGNVSIRIPATTTRQCLEVSAGGISGLFGATKEQCFNIPIPETIIDRALTAGGQGEIYLPEELLEKGEVILTVNSLPKPTGIDSLETSYALFETQGVDVLYGQ